ncbi:MAG: response regulator transcription factor [Lachnospiraceae bacterium]|nr:response regulator transcription factor [Bacillota bacterium]MCI6595003.1 response regulator transcription factor [Bacillota bacterium]MDD7253228.1 response regulator transcription factor [Bacillota bacterium]MDY2948571.1 response regulator transcription factor [Lachnospiraceae bacterium]
MKILLAEDTRDMNHVLAAALTHEGYDVDSAFDGEEALDFVRTNGYDAMVLDIMMPKKDGLQVLKELREENIVTPVLLLTAKAEVDDRVNGLDAGADDYLTKPFAMKELLARVRAMTRRKTEYAAKKLQYGDFSLDDEKFELSCENSVRLSVKEFELLQALILNQNHEVSTQYLLEHVWDGAEEAGPDTVWLYISYLRGKLRSVASNVEIEGERGSSFRLTEAGR